MNKKIICLLLSVLMLLSVCLTACGEVTDEQNIKDIEEEASASAVTLVMYLMSETPVSAEQEALMEEAVNKLTKDKYTTQIDLVYLTPDKYYTELEKNLAAQAANADIYVEEEEPTEEAPELDAYNIELIRYPAVKPNQVDIFYFAGYDKYSQYVNMEYLSLLDENVDGASKALYSYITPALLTSMKTVNQGLYAIPTNRAIGEYTYLLLNKDALNKTGYYDAEGGNFTSLTCEDTKDFLYLVQEFGLDYVPLYSATGELDISGYQYFGVDENGFLSKDFSLIGGSYANPSVYVDPENEDKEYDPYVGMNSVILDDNFVNQLLVLSEYRQNGYYNNEAVESGSKDFAVGYFKGNAQDVLQYADKYEIVTVEKPLLYAQDLYESMFGVSNYSVNMDRSMEIITYLNTDVEFRNLIQYGIEGVNYNAVRTEGEDEIQVSVIPGNGYNMDPMKTGNLLLTYTTVDQDIETYENDKKQNLDLSAVMNIQFRLDFNDWILDEDAAQVVRSASKVALDKIVECLENSPELLTKEFINSDTFGTFGTRLMHFVDQAVSKASTTLNGMVLDSGKMMDNGDIKNVEPEDTDETLPQSLKFIYTEWLIANELYVRPKKDS